MLYLSLQSRIFKILSGFPGLSFKKKRKEEENLIKATIKAKDSKAFSSDIATLFMAAQKGLPDVLRALLLSTKVDINATSPNGVTALSLAASKGYIEVVKALLAAKADVNATISMKGKTYTLLSIIPERHKETISLLKEYGAK
jgi:ankyrin repeat protein